MLVAIRDVTILEDVNVALAALIAASICDVMVGPVAVRGRAVDRTGGTRTVRENNGAPVTVEQN